MATPTNICSSVHQYARSHTYTRTFANGHRSAVAWGAPVNQNGQDQQFAPTRCYFQLANALECCGQPFLSVRDGLAASPLSLCVSSAQVDSRLVADFPLDVASTGGPAPRLDREMAVGRKGVMRHRNTHLSSCFKNASGRVRSGRVCIDSEGKTIAASTLR